MRRAVHVNAYLTRRFDIVRYNCWHLVRDVWRDMTDVDLGDLTPERVHVLALQHAATMAAKGPTFERLERPAQECIALLERDRWMPHVGVLIRGKLLHIGPSGTRYQELAPAAEGFTRVTFYLPASSCAPEAA